MPDYRRARVPGGTFFFTVVTYQQRPLLLHEPVQQPGHIQRFIDMGERECIQQVGGWQKSLMVSLVNNTQGKWCAERTLRNSETDFLLTPKTQTRNGGKPWKSLLIPHDAIAENMTLAGLTAGFSARSPSEA